MPDRTHLNAVARRLKRDLNGRAFLTVRRSTITDHLRAESGEPTTRLKAGLAEELTSALINQGVSRRSRASGTGRR